jgi:hypothetical protein
VGLKALIRGLGVGGKKEAMVLMVVQKVIYL